jgi:hypothetical protein
MKYIWEDNYFQDIQIFIFIFETNNEWMTPKML